MPKRARIALALPVAAAILALTACLGADGSSTPAPASEPVASSAPASSVPASSVAPQSQAASSQPQAPTARETLEEMLAEGITGKVPGCNFAVEADTIEDVEAAWGQADEADYVGDAKGIYYTYSSHNLVFGCNKGDQIFEIRSLDPALSAITRQDVQDLFGEEEYTATTAQGETVTGYTISDDMRIKFVFPTGAAAAQLNHYMVIKPSLTVNMMADDSGRAW